MKRPVIARSIAPEGRAAQTQAGLGLIELLVVMFISVLMLMGLFSIVYGTRQNYLAQNQLAGLQDSERLSMTLITNVVQTGGYFPNPNATYVKAALPAGTINGGVFAAGQSIYGVTPASGDQIYVRYVAGTSDGVMDCNGQTDPSAVSSQTDVNLFYVSNNQLYCQVTANGVSQAAQALVNGVTSMAILYGVDLNGDGSADEYMSAANVTASASWGVVVSVRVTLTFSNPLTGATAPGPGAPAAPTLTRTIDLLNKV